MKKRPFLMPLALSVMALLGTAVAGNTLASSLFDAKNNANSSSTAGAATSDFVITSSTNSSILAQHSSHESHGSHGSHGSHNSHNSHSSGS